jgi:hypothetical protein
MLSELDECRLEPRIRNETWMRFSRCGEGRVHGCWLKMRFREGVGMSFGRCGVRLWMNAECISKTITVQKTGVILDFTELNVRIW